MFEWYANVKGKLHQEDSFAITTSDKQEWYLDGKLHREDGPAITFSDDKQEWYLNGKLHREGGPARVCKGDKGDKGDKGNKEEWWYRDGNFYRLNGPAIIFEDGRQFWFIDGNQIQDKVIKLWMEENNIPADYTQWTNVHCVLFRLNF